MNFKSVIRAALAAAAVSAVFSFQALADYATYSSSGDLPAGSAQESSGTPGVIYAPGVTPGHSGTPQGVVTDYSYLYNNGNTAETQTPQAQPAPAPAVLPEQAAQPETAPASSAAAPAELPAQEPTDAASQQTQAAAQTGVDGNPNLIMSNGRAIDVTKPMVALTYDDGPQTNAGNRIMDVFARYGQRASFFMVGDRVSSRAAEVQRMVAEGHEVANHTYSHTYLNKVDAATIRKQVTACNDIIEQVTGVRPTIMRLPGGNKNNTVLQNVNMPIILWNIDTLDWKTRNAQSTINAVVGHVHNGDIVLMHELYDATAAATETIVPTLVEQGFQLVTVSELAAIRGVQLVPNQVYYSFK